jgi:tetratricopeptide (TPR) repeat protein
MAFEVPSLDEPPAWKEVPPAPPALTSADTLAGAPAFFPPPPSPGPDTLAAAVLGQSPFAAPEGEEPAPAPAAPDLSSTTLAELYLSQGIPEKALEVYEQLLEKDPQNERARARLREIKAQAAAPPSEPPAPAVPAPPTPSPVPPIVPDPHAERRLALQRAIARLEGLLAAVRRA